MPQSNLFSRKRSVPVPAAAHNVSRMPAVQERRLSDRNSGNPAHAALGQPAKSQQGFSIIETLIAASILLIIMVGLLPLFIRAVTDNAQGRQSTEVANAARSEVERLMQLGFNHPELTITAGSELETTFYYIPHLKQWKDSTSFTPDGTETFQRVTTIRQYSRSAIADDLLEEDEALPAGTDVSQIHLKEIEVALAGPSEFARPAKTVTLRVLRGI
jgi:type II secretory pathway pseudopilin PulG